MADGNTARSEIRRRQLAQLQKLIAAARASNAFYGPILRTAGIDEHIESLEEFSARMPLTEKTALAEDQRRTPPFGTNLTFPPAAYTRHHQTSATSGPPIRWLDTPESWQAMLDDWKQVYAGAGVTADDRLFFAFSYGPYLGFWMAFDAAVQLGALAIPGGGQSSLARLETLRDTRATVLLGTPTYIGRLAEVAEQAGIDLGQLCVRAIIVAGEPGGSIPAVRESIERRWPGAKLFDHHGMTEVGPVTWQCPESPGTLLVFESSQYAEILDRSTGRPVPPGEVGELVLTALRRTGSPVFRYRTGDLVREDTTIGPRFGRWEMALAGGILGRADDMVFVRGVNVYPAAVEEVLRAIPQIGEYRVELQAQGALTEMLLRIEVASGEADALVEHLQNRLRTRLALRVPIVVCPPGTLPRFEMKARRWVRV